MFNRTCLLRLLLGASIGCATLSIDAQTVRPLQISLLRLF